VANGVPEERYAVVYKRPTDLALLRDVPICANLLITDMFDEGAPCMRVLLLCWHADPSG
jgi:protein arginine N-methyltransferase 7